MRRRGFETAAALALLLCAGCALRPVPRTPSFDAAVPFASELASNFSEVRLTISPDGRTALWFSRNRPGGPGGYDIWMSRRGDSTWSAPEPVSFNSPTRDFDPAFSADGRFVYFCSDRAGGAGGDDLWRVAVTSDGFAPAEWLGAAVNSPRNEWAPMLSPDGRTLLFSSDGHAGAGRMDLFTSGLAKGRFQPPRALPGETNTSEDEFDASFLEDGRSIVFTRAPDLKVDSVLLYFASPHRGNYPRGELLPELVNTPGSDSYAPMLDWSLPGSLTFTTRRPADSARGADVYVVKYRAWNN